MSDDNEGTSPGGDDEINDLNALLRAMNDAHRSDLGQFRRFMPFLPGRSGDVTEQEEEEFKSILRDIQSIVRGGDATSVLTLDFEGVCDEQNWTNIDMYDEDYGYPSWAVQDSERKERRFFLSQGFSRGVDNKSISDRVMSLTRQQRVIDGLGQMIHSLPQQVKLVSLNLSGNIMTCNDAVYASELLKGMTTLTELDLSCNQIGGDGGEAIFRTLLGDDAACNIKKLNMKKNRLKIPYDTRRRDPTPTLVDVLRTKNRSLVELNLSETGIKLSSALLDVFIPIQSIRDGSFDPWDMVDNHNHHLKDLRVDTTERGERVLQSVLSFNADGPETALAMKLERYFDKHEKEYYDKGPEYVVRCLELAGVHGNLFTLMKLVRNFQAHGALLDGLGAKQQD